MDQASWRGTPRHALPIAMEDSEDTYLSDPKRKGQGNFTEKFTWKWRILITNPRRSVALVIANKKKEKRKRRAHIVRAQETQKRVKFRCTVPDPVYGAASA